MTTIDQIVWKEVCDEIYNGKYGIWLEKLKAWSKDGSGNIYKYRDKKTAEHYASLFYHDHGGVVIKYKRLLTC